MRNSLFLAIALGAAQPALAQEIPGSSFSAGYWQGSAQADDNGLFSYCQVSIGYTQGETLWLGLYNNDTLAVLLSSPEVGFTEGDTFDAWLMTETGLPTQGIAEAWDAAFAGMTLTGIEPSIAFLTQGRYLRLLGIGIDNSYDVTGMSDALALAKSCLQKHGGVAAAATAPAPKLVPKTAPGTVGIGIKPGPGKVLGIPAPKPANP